MRHRTNHDGADDPADWNAASYTAHPIDLIEPEIEATAAYREASIRMLKLVLLLDTLMSGSRDARLMWVAISFALGLTSTRGKTETQVANEIGITKQALSRRTAKVLRAGNLPPAFGLKSTTARRNYQKCH